MSHNNQNKISGAYDRLGPSAQKYIDTAVDEIIDIAARLIAERDFKRAQRLQNDADKPHKNSFS